MAFTKVVGPGIHTLAQLRTHNIHSAGIITATRFVGEIGAGTGSTSTFTNVNITGNLTVQGDQTTLNTTLRNVELLRVASNSATTAGIITQTGAGDILNLFDATSEVVTVTDGGKVGIGTTNPTSLLEIFGGDVKIGSAGQTVGYGVTISSQYGQIKFPDGETGGTKIGNLSFGDGADFRIVHDQHHNYLTAYNGDIYLGTASHTPLRVKQSSASVELWYAGGKTLETVSGGVKVTGNTNALQVQSTGEVQVVIGSTNAGGAGIYFDGDSNGDWSGSDYSHILHNTSGDMEYNADNPGGATNHIFKTAGGERLRITSDGQLLHSANKSTGYLARFNQAHADNPAEIEINSPNDNNLRPASIQLMNDGTDKWGIGQVYASTSSGAFHLCAGSTSQANSKFTITTAGLVGIGTINPSTSLHAYGGSTGFRLEREGSNPGYYNISISHGTPVGANNYGSAYFTLSQSTGDYVWKSATNERMRLLGDSGHLGINNDNPQSAIQAKGVTGTLGAQAYPQLTLQTASTNGAADTGAGIMFHGHDGSGGAFHATIRGLKENGTSGNRDSYLSFGTRANGASIVEKMRIGSTGHVAVGAVPATGLGLFSIKPNSSADAFFKVRPANDFDGSATGSVIDNRNSANNASNDFIIRSKTMRFWMGDSGGEKVRITSGGSLQVKGSSGIAFSTNEESDNFSGTYAGYHTDNHGNQVIGLNLHLNYNNSNSGTHQVKQTNAHSSIGSAGMFIGGNGSDNNSDICFFSNSQGSSAGATFGQDAWKLRIAQGETQSNYNILFKQRGYFRTETSYQTSTNCPAMAVGNSYAFGYQEAWSTSGGGWSNPYPNLVFGYHTGILFGGHPNYNGCRFYSDHPSSSSSIVLSIGNGGSGVHVTNTLSKGGGSFRIAHPHPTKKYTHDLQHSFIEGPQCDNIYRGKVDLVGGSASINIDTVSNMTDGTFVLLNRDIQCFTSNETGWDAVKGSVSGNVLTITSQNNSSTDTISWMVIGERQDDKIKSPDMDMTDSDGKLIVEPLTIEETHM